MDNIESYLQSKSKQLINLAERYEYQKNGVTVPERKALLECIPAKFYEIFYGISNSQVEVLEENNRVYYKETNLDSLLNLSDKGNVYYNIVIAFDKVLSPRMKAYNSNHTIL